MQFTFWNENETQEHLTLTFHDGVIWHLSREETRSVVAEWHAIGTYVGHLFMFDTKVPHSWVAATQLHRKGGTIVGAHAHLDAKVTSRKTDETTDPETLMGQGRERSLSLGSVTNAERGSTRFGERYTCDPHAMRAAILARK